LEAQRTVTTEEAQKKAKNLGAVLYIEVSAKTQSAKSDSKGGLEKSIEALGEEILTVFKDEFDTNYDNSSMSGAFNKTVTINSSRMNKKKKSKKKSNKDEDSGCC
jgi:hypothetical protein